MTKKDKLVEQYSGTGASGYDDRRRTTVRFKSEVEVFGRLFSQASPTWVIDCPFGTGRWIDHYLSVDGPIIAVDASAAMLEQAQTKIEAAGAKIQMVVGSIFDPSIFKRPKSSGDGLIVCIRFLNWISIGQVSQALDSMATAGAHRMIVGVSVYPESWSWLRRTISRLRLLLINLPASLRGQPTPFVHREEEVREQFSVRGWKVISRDFVYRDSCRVNYFYLIDSTASVAPKGVNTLPTAD